MQNLLSNFSGLALSRAEMKKVLGGVWCTIIYKFRDGSTMNNSGNCSGSSASQCQNYAHKQVASMVFNNPDISSGTADCY